MLIIEIHHIAEFIHFLFFLLLYFPFFGVDIGSDASHFLVEGLFDDEVVLVRVWAVIKRVLFNFCIFVVDLAGQLSFLFCLLVFYVVRVVNGLLRVFVLVYLFR